MFILALLLAATGARAEQATTGGVGFQLGGDEPRMVIKLGFSKIAAKGEMLAGQGVNISKVDERMADMKKLAAEALASQGEESAAEKKAVTIHFPLIDYGSGGGFGDAVIQSNGGISIDPGYFRETGLMRYNGTVSISEFTRFVIAGSYSASLYAPKPKKELEDRGHVSGTFRIALPILSDPRHNSELSRLEQSRIASSSLWSALRNAGLSLDDISDLPDPGRHIIAGGGGNGAATASKAPHDCTCECEFMAVERQRPDCVQQCKPVWAIINCAAAQQSAPPPDEAEVQRFQARLKQMGMPENVIRSMTDSYRRSSPQDREAMSEGLGAAYQNRTKQTTAPAGGLDTETQQYLQALKKKKPDMTPDLLNMAADIFRKSDPAGRKFLWQKVQEMP